MGTEKRKARRPAAWASWIVLVLVAVSLTAALLSTGFADATSEVRGHTSAPDTSDDQRRSTSTPERDVLPVAAGRARPAVVLYGDSLAWESNEHFVWALTAAGADVKTRVMGGTAICDFLNTMRKDAEHLRPDAVVVEFTGNAITPCMRGARVAMAGLEPLDAYQVDSEEVLRVFSKARVYFVGGPRGEETNAEQRLPRRGDERALPAAGGSTRVSPVRGRGSRRPR